MTALAGYEATVTRGGVHKSSASASAQPSAADSAQTVADIAPAPVRITRKPMTPSASAAMAAQSAIPPPAPAQITRQTVLSQSTCSIKGDGPGVLTAPGLANMRRKIKGTISEAAKLEKMMAGIKTISPADGAMRPEERARFLKSLATWCLPAREAFVARVNAWPTSSAIEKKSFSDALKKLGDSQAPTCNPPVAMPVPAPEPPTIHRNAKSTLSIQKQTGSQAPKQAECQLHGGGAGFFSPKSLTALKSKLAAPLSPTVMETLRQQLCAVSGLSDKEVKMVTKMLSQATVSQSQLGTSSSQQTMHSSDSETPQPVQLQGGGTGFFTPQRLAALQANVAGSMPPFAMTTLCEQLCSVSGMSDAEVKKVKKILAEAQITVPDGGVMNASEKQRFLSQVPTWCIRNRQEFLARLRNWPNVTQNEVSVFLTAIQALGDTQPKTCSAT
ncbi:hypothetical protein FRB95_011212 [Tulasnella sp. JGI-2019a]|nr:hypothetical protein FRB95_011212 [Tulasnella sp. JGI-2019a]